MLLKLNGLTRHVQTSDRVRAGGSLLSPPLFPIVPQTSPGPLSLSLSLSIHAGIHKKYTQKKRERGRGGEQGPETNKQKRMKEMSMKTYTHLHRLTSPSSVNKRERNPTE